MNKGFTIAEILVAIAIVAFLGTIMVSIFISTLQGSNKSQILGSIKQNGQAVLENMDKTVRAADNVCVSQGTFTLVIEKAGSYTRLRFIAPITGANPANGKIQQDSPPSGLNVESFLTRICTDTDPLVDPITLTDTNPQTGVSVISGSFTRNQQAGSKDNVTVSFTLGPGVQAPPIVAGQIEPVKFQTTIQLR